MVQRPEQQDRVYRGVAEVQETRVADGGAQPIQSGRVGFQLPDVQGHQVPVLDPVPKPGQPQRVPPRSAADVGDQRGPGRQVPQDDLGGPEELELPAAGH